MYLEQLESANAHLNKCFFACVIHLLFPLNVLLEWFFLSKTNRKPSDIDVNFVNELCLFCVTLYWLTSYSGYTIYNPDLDYADKEMTVTQIHITNLISYSVGTDEQKYPFNFILAAIASNTWGKLLLKLRITKTFGPLFKVIQKMVVDLASFLVIWLLELLIISSISLVFFGQLSYFR